MERALGDAGLCYWISNRADDQSRRVPANQKRISLRLSTFAASMLQRSQTEPRGKKVVVPHAMRLP